MPCNCCGQPAAYLVGKIRHPEDRHPIEPSDENSDDWAVLCRACLNRVL